MLRSKRKNKANSPPNPHLSNSVSKASVLTELSENATVELCVALSCLNFVIMDKVWSSEVLHLEV